MGNADSPRSQPSAHPLPRGLKETRVIGILRRCPPAAAVRVVGAAVAEGLAVVEVTLDSEDALLQVAELRNAFSHIQVGVGTVVTREDCRNAVAAGATFVVSPVVDRDVILAGHMAGVPVIPGAATPTEILTAVRLGVPAVKVFPIGQLGGPSFLSAVMQPLFSPPLIPTGGVDADSAVSYLEAGAVAVGVGGSLFPSAAMQSVDLAKIQLLARGLVEAVSTS